MSGRYAPLPNPLGPTAEHELDATFESDDEDEDRQEETTPLNHPNPPPESVKESRAGGVNSNEASRSAQRATMPGTYDFEADPFDYAVPPPGSPPGPTAFAVPNHYGNSNGLIPSNPVIPRQWGRRTGFFRRVAGALLPSYYQRLETEDGTRAGPVRGGGTNNDGVFANLTAKPGRGIVVRDGESIHVVPEDVQKEAPPSYAVAQADSAPGYYETIVHAPSSGMDGEVLVDSMPTGSIFTFAWTMLISLSFQFVGFMLTYLLHTTHAAKFGSRAGLGITIIQYAFFLRRRALLTATYEENQENQLWWEGNTSKTGDGTSTFSAGFNGTSTDASSTPPSSHHHGYFSPGGTEWLSFFLMSAGWFILLTSLLGFLRVKRWERGIRQASEPPPILTAEDLERDRNFVSGVLEAFGVSVDEHEVEDGETATPPVSSAGQSDEDARLRRDLRASGLL